MSPLTWALSLGLVAQLAAPSFAWAGRKSDELKPEDLGLKVTRGHGFFEWVDPEYGIRLRTTLDLGGRIQQQEVTTLGGRFIERQEFRPDSWIRERFLPEGTEIEIHTHPRPDVLRIERLPAGARPERGDSWEIAEYSMNQAMACSFPVASEFVTKPIETAAAGGAFTGFVFDDYKNDRMAGPHDADESYLGYNAVALGCADYPKPGGGGVAQVGKDLTVAIKTGIGCLAKLGAERKLDAIHILSYYQGDQDGTLLPGRVRFLCTTGVQRGVEFKKVIEKRLASRGRDADDRGAKISADEAVKFETIAARAVACPESNPPAAILNFPMGRQTDAQRASTLFHEMVHWLGKFHVNGQKDVPYLSEMCCFPQGLETPLNASDSSAACDLLKAGDSAYSAADNDRFKALLKKSTGRSEVTDSDGR